MDEYLSFQKMITPVIVKILFWVGVAAVVIGGLVTFFGGKWIVGSVLGGMFMGIIMIPIGILMVRLYAELIIIIFMINDHLSEIRKNTARSA